MNELADKRQSIATPTSGGKNRLGALSLTCFLLELLAFPVDGWVMHVRPTILMGVLVAGLVLGIIGYYRDRQKVFSVLGIIGNILFGLFMTMGLLCAWMIHGVDH